MKDYEIIGLVGHQGVGKNYIGENILQDALVKKNTLCVAFADHFKITAIGKHNADPQKVFGKKDYETRKLLQRLGTEEGRNVFGENVWVKTLEAWMDMHYSRGVERFIITDVRFVNEAEWVKRCGGKLIKIEAPDRYHDRLIQESGGNQERYDSIKNHPSEKNIENIKNIDFVINNSKTNQSSVQSEIVAYFNSLKREEPSAHQIAELMENTYF